MNSRANQGEKYEIDAIASGTAVPLIVMRARRIADRSTTLASLPRLPSVQLHRRLSQKSRQGRA
jgi:hypothetical protein